MADSDSSDDLEEPMQQAPPAVPLVVTPPTAGVKKATAEAASSDEEEDPPSRRAPIPAPVPADDEDADDEDVHSSIGTRPIVTTLPSAAMDEQLARQRANTTLRSTADGSEIPVVTTSFVDVEGLAQIDVRVREHKGTAASRCVYTIPRNRFRHAPFRSATGEVMSAIDMPAAVFLDKNTSCMANTRDLIATHGPDKIVERLFFVESAEEGACEKVCPYLPVNIVDWDKVPDASVKKCFDGATSVWMPHPSIIGKLFEKGLTTTCLPKDIEPVDKIRVVAELLPKVEANMDAGWIKITNTDPHLKVGRNAKAAAEAARVGHATASTGSNEECPSLPPAAALTNGGQASDQASTPRAVASVAPAAVAIGEARGGKRSASTTTEMKFDKKARLFATPGMVEDAIWPEWAVSATVTTSVVFRD